VVVGVSHCGDLLRLLAARGDSMCEAISRVNSPGDIWGKKI